MRAGRYRWSVEVKKDPTVNAVFPRLLLTARKAASPVKLQRSIPAEAQDQVRRSFRNPEEWKTKTIGGQIQRQRRGEVLDSRQIVAAAESNSMRVGRSKFQTRVERSGVVRIACMDQ